MTQLIDNISLGNLTSLAPNKFLIKIYPDIGLPYIPPFGRYFLKETIQVPLSKWCDECFNNSYSLNYRFNSGEPYWSLLFNSSEDVNIFMLRFGSNTN